MKKFGLFVFFVALCLFFCSCTNISGKATPIPEVEESPMGNVSKLESIISFLPKVNKVKLFHSGADTELSEATVEQVVELLESIDLSDWKLIAPEFKTAAPGSDFELLLTSDKNKANLLFIHSTGPDGTALLYVNVNDELNQYLEGPTPDAYGKIRRLLISD